MEEKLLAVPRDARPYQGHRAGVVTRAITIGVDVVTATLTLAVGLAGLNALLFALRPRTFQPLTAPLLVSVTTALAAFVLYLTVAWSLSGRTYGDHLMGLRVVDRHGRNPRPLRAFVRAVLYVVFPIGLLWCIGNRSRRTLQDRVLGTSVIYDWVGNR